MRLYFSDLRFKKYTPGILKFVLGILSVCNPEFKLYLFVNLVSDEKLLEEKMRKNYLIKIIINDF